MASMQEENDDREGSRNLNTTLLRKLSSAVNGHAATATFACGGSVPGYGSVPGEKKTNPSITLRWDSTSGNSTISFPRRNGYDLDDSVLRGLLSACQPATFGMGGQDVLDEDYRKASKLDPTAFSTNFHPQNHGILDSIQQILLPSTIKGGQGIGMGPEGVRAELYKLNV